MIFFSNRACFMQVTVVFLFLLVASVSIGDTLQPTPRVDTNNQYKLNKYSQYESDKRQSSFNYQFNIEENRIQVDEPYKTLIQSTARFAIVQTKLTKYVSIETIMSLVNQVGYVLSKPSTLIKVVKVVAVSIASLLATSFLFPAGFRFIESLLRSPVNTLKLDKYLVVDINERSIQKLLNGTLNETLSRIGLDDSCLQRTVCHGAELIKQVFPDAAETMTEFASDYHLKTNFINNEYVKAFSDGFFDNCNALIGSMNLDQGTDKYCLGNILNSVLQSFRMANDKKNKYQNIKVERA